MSWRDAWLAQVSADYNLKPSEIETLMAQRTWTQVQASKDYDMGQRVFDQGAAEALEQRGYARWTSAVGGGVTMRLTAAGDDLARVLMVSEWRDRP